MRDNSRLAVIVPLYSFQLSENEIVSLNQVKTILDKYDIIAITPPNLSVNNKYFTRTESFSPDFFTSIEAYNRLMLSPDFYRRFQDYEYILIYQLDAFVFSDQLSYFCNLGYDYIGAPWLHGIFNYIDSSHYLWHVGNGGLSLRRVESFIRILEDRKPLQGEQIKNEDLFFSSIVDDQFKVAPMEIALQFSFERQVKKCFALNHNQLPFGCHAWSRYDLEFWKPYIEQYGYEIRGTDKSGNEDITREQEYLLWENFSNNLVSKYGIVNVSQKIKEKFSHAGNSCIIFGAGFYGKSVSSWFTDIGISVRYFCDNNRKLEGKTLNGYCIIHPSSLVQHRRNSLIVIVNYQFENQIVEQLESMNYEKNKDFITFTDLIETLE